MLTNISLLHVFNAGMPLRPVCHYGQCAITANTPLRPIRANTPLRPIRHYGQYTITANMCQYAITANTPLQPIRHYNQYAPIRHYGHYVPIRHYGQYAITANMPLWPICHYGVLHYLSCINPNRNTQAACHGIIKKKRRKRNKVQTVHAWYLSSTPFTQRSSALQSYLNVPSTSIYGTSTGEE